MSAEELSPHLRADLEPEAPPVRADLEQQSATVLPAKEVMSLLDLNVNVDLALDLVAPIDLAVAGNLNVAAPINAGVAAGLMAVDSDAAAVADQGVLLDQTISGTAHAFAPQDSVVDQADDGVLPAPDPTVTTPAGDLMSGPLLNVDVDVDVDADLAAPIAGAVALNGNVAAPVNAGAAANILTVGSTAGAMATQDAIITQHLDDVVADATADQDSQIGQ
jgi:hypothetical protein